MSRGFCVRVDSSHYCMLQNFPYKPMYCRPISDPLIAKLQVLEEVFQSDVHVQFILSCWWPSVHTRTTVWAFKLPNCHLVPLDLQSDTKRTFLPDSLGVSHLLHVKTEEESKNSTADKATTLSLLIFIIYS